MPQIVETQVRASGDFPSFPEALANDVVANRRSLRGREYVGIFAGIGEAFHVRSKHVGQMCGKVHRPPPRVGFRCRIFVQLAANLVRLLVDVQAVAHLVIFAENKQDVPPPQPGKLGKS